MSAYIVILLMGVYMLGGGLAMLLGPGRLRAMMNGFADQPALSYLAGAIMAPLGAAVLLWFHDFSSVAHGIATVLGAGLLIEGWLMMVAPKTLMSAAKPFMMGTSGMRITGMIVAALAALAIWYGLSG